jgi:hypothetical protein
MQTTKVIEEGRVYASTDYGDGTLVVEKIDPTFTHDAPASVTTGAEVTVTFTLRDFDGAQRNDSGGTLHLDIGGTAVELPDRERAGVTSNRVARTRQHQSTCSILLRCADGTASDRGGDRVKPEVRVIDGKVIVQPKSEDAVARIRQLKLEQRFAQDGRLTDEDRDLALLALLQHSGIL